MSLRGKPARTGPQGERGDEARKAAFPVPDLSGHTGLPAEPRELLCSLGRPDDDPLARCLDDLEEADAPDYDVVRALVAIGFRAPHRVSAAHMVTSLAFEIESAAESSIERRLAAIVVSDAVETAVLEAAAATPDAGAVLADGTPVRIERGVRRLPLVRRRNPNVVVFYTPDGYGPDGRRVMLGLAALRPILPSPAALACEAVAALRRARVSDFAVDLLTSPLGRRLREVFGARRVWAGAGGLVAEAGVFTFTASSRSDDDEVDAGVAVVPGSHRSAIALKLVLTVEETLSLAQAIAVIHDRLGERRRLRHAVIRSFTRVALELAAGQDRAAILDGLHADLRDLAA